MCIHLPKSTIKKLQNRSTRKSLCFRLMCLLHPKLLHMRKSHKLPSLHQRLPRHLEHWALMAIPRRLRFTGCTAPGLGRAIPDMKHMRRMLLCHNLANSLVSRCHQTLAMYEPISHLPLRCNMATAPLICLHQLAPRPLDPFRHIQQRPLVCHSPPRRLINFLRPDLHFRDRKLHLHRVVRATEHSVFPRRSQARLFQLRQKPTVRHRSLREPSIEVLCHPLGCQNVAM